MYYFEDILIAIIFILAHLLLLGFNYFFFRKKIMHPSVLFSLIWFFVLCMHFIFSFTILDELPPLNISTYLIFLIGAIAFTLGSVIKNINWQKTNKFNLEKIHDLPEEDIDVTLSIILLAISVIGLPFFLYTSYKIYSVSNVESFLIGLRSELLYGDEDIGFLKYLFPFSLVVYSFILKSFFKKPSSLNKVLLIISTIITLTYAIFTTGRLIFLIILVMYLGMRFVNTGHFHIKKFFGLIFLFLLTFIGMGILYNKGGNSENSITDNIQPAAQGTAIYMVASLNALDKELHDQFHITNSGNNSLRFFIKLGSEIGLLRNSKVNDLLTPFILTPYPTNVYTIYSNYIEDFGRFYAWFVMAFLGFIQSGLFNLSVTTKKFRYSFYYSILLYPLLISFFADQYLTLISFWIQLIVMVESIILLNKLFLSINVQRKLILK